MPLNRPHAPFVDFIKLGNIGMDANSDSRFRLSGKVIGKLNAVEKNYRGNPYSRWTRYSSTGDVLQGNSHGVFRTLS
ncbi:hypothetical protein [Nitrosospira sp. Nsp13]|uniref:hypothetical protein n=1 Tax=Nitrosospira sp. Nsp13 TaxID=1855332 RepID=UPI0011130DEC|nr:hypothetical protein [Nitrosospira sp. Nsp13]